GAVRDHAGADRSGLLAGGPRGSVRGALAEWDAARVADREGRALAVIAGTARAANACAQRCGAGEASARASRGRRGSQADPLNDAQAQAQASAVAGIAAPRSGGSTLRHRLPFVGAK